MSTGPWNIPGRSDLDTAKSGGLGPPTPIRNKAPNWSHRIPGARGCRFLPRWADLKLNLINPRGWAGCGGDWGASRHPGLCALTASQARGLQAKLRNRKKKIRPVPKKLVSSALQIGFPRSAIETNAATGAVLGPYPPSLQIGIHLVWCGDPPRYNAVGRPGKKSIRSDIPANTPGSGPPTQAIRGQTLGFRTPHFLKVTSL